MTYRSIASLDRVMKLYAARIVFTAGSASACFDTSNSGSDQNTRFYARFFCAFLDRLRIFSITSVRLFSLASATMRSKSIWSVLGFVEFRRRPETSTPGALLNDGAIIQNFEFLLVRASRIDATDMSADKLHRFAFYPSRRGSRERRNRRGLSATALTLSARNGCHGHSVVIVSCRREEYRA